MQHIIMWNISESVICCLLILAGKASCINEQYQELKLHNIISQDYADIQYIGNVNNTKNTGGMRLGLKKLLKHLKAMDAHVIICIFKDHVIFEKFRQTHINRHWSILHISSLPFHQEKRYPN